LTYKTEGCRKINQEMKGKEARYYWNFTHVQLSQTCVMTQCKARTHLRGVQHLIGV